MGQNALIILDVVVIFCLSITIPYMFSLMKNIKSIKAGKSDLQRLVSELTASINKADRALLDMKNAVEGKGKDIEKMLGQASTIIDEMTFINKASDNLAERLGYLVTEGGKIIDEQSGSKRKSTNKKSQTKKNKKDDSVEDMSDDVLNRLEKSLARHDDLDEIFPIDENFKDGLSRSEKELAKVLDKKK